MKLAIMQPYFMPYIGYFQLINAVDKFVVCDDVNFIKRGWINRNYILINGKKHLFTIPLKDKSQNKYINEIEILNDNNWKIKFLRKILITYKKAPYFESIFTLISDIILYKKLNIAYFIFNSLTKICNYLEINTTFNFSSRNYKKDGLKGRNRIFDICKKEKANTYINPIGGIELYNKKDFAKCNIKLFFLKTGNIAYRQFNNKFVENLSIIDVLMFNSKEQINKFLENFELI